VPDGNNGGIVLRYRKVLPIDAISGHV